MSNSDMMPLAETWIALQYANPSTDAHESNFWAHNEVDSLLTSDPDRAWEIIKEILKKDESDFIISNLAAGPLEDLLVRHREDYIERIEQYSNINHRFRTMLYMVWRNDISEAVWARAQRAASQN